MEACSRAPHVVRLAEVALHVPLAELEGRADDLPQDRPVITCGHLFHPDSSRGEGAFAAWWAALGVSGPLPYRVSA